MTDLDRLDALAARTIADFNPTMPVDPATIRSLVAAARERDELRAGRDLLDVERLARAIYIVDGGHGIGTFDGMQIRARNGRIRKAADIAREYRVAALHHKDGAS